MFSQLLDFLDKARAREECRRQWVEKQAESRRLRRSLRRIHRRFVRIIETQRQKPD